MFNKGLIWKYRINRPISREDHKLQLKQQVRADVDPADQLALIRINSTFLESVDKYFSWKGWLTFVMLVALVLLLVPIALLGAFVRDAFTPDGPEAIHVFSLAALVLFIVVPMAVACIWALRKDSFRFTHYPIRLNRKSRTVHVFRLDGTVLTVPWDEVLFTLGREDSFLMRGPQFWEIQGHVLDQDGLTVRETFAFHDVEGPEVVRRHWEFLRRYMEDGPEDLVNRIQHYAPVDRRRETFREGLRRIFANDSGFLWAQIMAAPINFLIACGRWVAMRTSKIPQWPPEVEAACRVEPGDPYERDARTAVAPNR